MLNQQPKSNWFDQYSYHLEKYIETDAYTITKKFVQECNKKDYLYDLKLKDFEHGKVIFKADPHESLTFLMILISEVIQLDLQFLKHSIKGKLNLFSNTHYHDRFPYDLAINTLMKRKLPYQADDINLFLSWINELGRCDNYHDLPLGSIIRALEFFSAQEELSQSQKLQIESIISLLKHERYIDADLRKHIMRLESLICDNTSELKLPLAPGEAWSDAAILDIQAMTVNQSSWIELLNQCLGASNSKPSKKWLSQAQATYDKIGFDEFKAKMLAWLPLIDKPRTQALAAQDYGYYYDTDYIIGDAHMDILKGLLWLSNQQEDQELARLLSTVCLSAYKKIPNLGPRAIRVGNAAVYSLGEMPGLAGVHQLAFLKVKVKYRAGLLGIEKALKAAAKTAGLTVDELEEMGVPSYGLQSIGSARESVGEFTAIINIKRLNKVELSWLKADGKTQKSIPSSVKQDYAEELKDIKANIKDLQKMLPAQRDRIELNFLRQKRWPFSYWRKYYLDHPMVGYIAGKLIWNLHSEEKQAVIFTDDNFNNIHGETIVPDENCEVSLWHPIDSSTNDVHLWRERLETLQWVQPFKQAHREIYILTDAERNTNTYSNRFAAHIIKQHQFNALCSQRGWRYSLQGCWDGGCDSVASIELPQWDLRAEFWVNGIGDYGNDTSEAGIYLYLATDQVRFYNLENSRNIELSDVPPLALSEVFRDVDLFVGVCSVGNNPEWADGGPDGRFYDYWQDYSFGELRGSAKQRKELLERLIPRLKIKDQCEFTDRFLKVRGKFRTYKIHFGSSNILMEPNDQYLCIVKGRGEDSLYLPFEGDGILSLILSKAILLAEDYKIKDSTILSQIKH